jgi:hypothetical protein
MFTLELSPPTSSTKAAVYAACGAGVILILVARDTSLGDCVMSGGMQAGVPIFFAREDAYL